MQKYFELSSFLLQQVLSGRFVSFGSGGFNLRDDVRLDGEELGDIESGSLEGLDFSDDAVSDGEDLLGLGGDFGRELVRNEFSNEVLEGAFADFLGDHIDHLLSDLFDLGSLSVGGGFELMFGSVGEGKGEESEDESVGGLGVDSGLDEGVPFLNERAEVVSGRFHSIEVGQGNSSLGLAGVVDYQSDFLGGQS